MSPLPERRRPRKPLFGKGKPAAKRETVKAEKPRPAKKATAKKTTKKAKK